MLWASAVWALLKNGLSSLLGVVAKYPFPCALAVVLGLLLWERHEYEGVLRREATEKAAYTATIARQDAAIQQWRIVGQSKQDKATAALASVKQANTGLLNAAARIEHSVPPTVIQEDCRTPPEVMEAKDQL